MKVVSSPSIASRIELAFQSASSTTGTDFAYLVKTAERESNFNVSAKAKTSSATGLFQFIEQTWLETLKQSGDRHGLGDYAKDISRRSDGRYYVADAARRREILDLRKDPEAASLMAGELTAKNGAYLESRLGREPSNGELYIAHFLGAGGATKLISHAESNPEARADTLFPRQARANRSIFYTSSGKARSVQSVYDRLVRQHDAPASRQFASVVTPGQAAPLPVAKADALTATPAGDGGTATVANVLFPAERSLPAGDHNFAFLTQSTPALQAQLTAQLAEAREKGQDLPVPAAKPGIEAPAPMQPVVTAAAAAEPAAVQPVQTAAASEAAPTMAFAPEPAEADVVATRFAQLSDQPVETPADYRLDPDARVASAWRAAMPSTPFQALFRNDTTIEAINPSYLRSFAAQADADPGVSGLAHALAAKASQEAERGLAGTSPDQRDEQAAVAAPASGRDGGERGPLNLIGALRYQIFKEPEDLLPPV